MTISEKRSEKIAARVIICARKMKGLTQNDVTKRLGMAQSTLSRIEAGILVPSVLVWMELTDLLEMPVDSLKYGVIDYVSDTELRSGNVENGFKIPNKYSQLKCLKVRGILPLMTFVREKWGVDAFEKVCKVMKVDKDFFTCLDNQLNLKFLDDVVKYIVNNFGFDPNMMDEVFENMKLPELHGRLFEDYQGLKSKIEIVKLYLNFLTKYQVLFFNEVNQSELSELDIKCKVNPILAQDLEKCNKITRDYLSMFHKKGVSKLAALNFAPTASGNIEVLDGDTSDFKDNVLNYFVKVA